MNLIIYKKNFLINVTHFLAEKINKNRNILITGGTTVRKIYSRLSEQVNFKNKFFYLSDERFAKKKTSTNKYLVDRYFIKNKKINFVSFNISNKNKQFTTNYTLPKKIDLSILSFGFDGHIASIFFNKKRIMKFKNFEIVNNSDYQRISVSRDIIKNSKEVILLCAGKKKGSLLKKHMLTKYGFFGLGIRNISIVFDKFSFSNFLK